MLRELRLLLNIVTLLRLLQFVPKLLMVAAVIYVALKLHQSDITPAVIQNTISTWFEQGVGFATKQIATFINQHKGAFATVLSPFMAFAVMQVFADS